MRNLPAFALMVMFLMNTIAVSAWAKPCVSGNVIKMTHEMQMQEDVDSDIPCHKKKPVDQNKHCDGVCLCLHHSTVHAFVMSDLEDLLPPDVSGRQIVVTQDFILSRSTLPPRRPPKITS